MVHSWRDKVVKIVTQVIMFSAVTVTCATTGAVIGIVIRLAPKVVITKALDPIPVTLLYPITFGCKVNELRLVMTNELTSELLTADIICVAAIKTKKTAAIMAAYVLKITM